MKRKVNILNAALLRITRPQGGAVAQCYPPWLTKTILPSLTLIQSK